jgi:GH15 family glucan-1,4-alpha-glucosidase
LRLRLTGAAHAKPDRSGALTTELTLREGARHDLVLQIGRESLEPRVNPTQLWSATEAAWAKVVPDCSDIPASRDARQAYAILHGLTSSGGGMVAAATTSLPERAPSGRSYDYRYAWIRDQCYAGNAVAAHSALRGATHPLLDDAVGFVTERILQDGAELRPAYRVDGGEVPSEHELDLPGYPGGSDKIGNHAASQFQLDAFGEALSLFAAAARLGRLGDDSIRAAHLAADAVAEHWQDPDAGIWELKPAWWTHSRLAAAVGLQAAAAAVPGGGKQGWDRLAAKIVNRTKQRCRHPDGYWQRAADDSRLDAAVLRPLAIDPRLCGARSLTPTRRAIQEKLTEDDYVYRFRHDDAPLGEAEGAFLLCGFFMARACHVENKPVDAARWFERTRTSCGPAGLFTEEYDVLQRQMRGNLPQAFVHALLLETAVILAGDRE